LPEGLPARGDGVLRGPIDPCLSETEGEKGSTPVPREFKDP